MSQGKNAAHLNLLKEQLCLQARHLGFEVCRITSPEAIPEAPERLRQWLKSGAHGDMHWMGVSEDRRSAPKTLWPEVKRIIILGLNYGVAENPLEGLLQPSNGYISIYARHRDYHDLIKTKLKQLAHWLLKMQPDSALKLFVDTAPVMEKPLAQAAGLGWQGKHTNLVSRQFGSWLFLGSIFTTVELPVDSSEKDHCGACRACLEICPTKAFPKPYQLDARKCISYLTIEHKGPIPRHLRPALGNRIYGCDDCLAVCPWNKFAQSAQEIKLQAREDLNHPPLDFLAQLDDSSFRSYFSGSPIKRIGWIRFRRNVFIAVGNTKDKKYQPRIIQNLTHLSPLVRGAAIWALRQVCTPEEFASFANLYRDQEGDPTVGEEWQPEGRQLIGYFFGSSMSEEK